MDSGDVTLDGPPRGMTSSKSLGKGESRWRETDASVKQSRSVKESRARSSTKLEEKFKSYVSEAELMLRRFSAVDDDATSIFENMCDSRHLLERNTESFRCLTQLLISSNSLTKNRLFLFPPLEDPGLDMAFNFEEPMPENDDIGVQKYQKLCENMEIVPISRIIKSLETEILDLKYYGLTNKQIRALTEALKVNAHVQVLILRDNWLTVEMTQMVSDMIVENISLQHLSLYECRIGEEGALKLGEVLSSLQTLKSLDLSFNELGDRGMLALKDGLCGNASLKQLNLSHNNLTEDSAETMEKILLENKNIDNLDLSWNGFFTGPGNRRLFSGFMNSDRIRFLNLAWNGIGIIPAVRPLTRYIRKSEHLEELDLSNNRLVDQSLMMTRAAINKNHSLQIVKIGNNIYAPEQAHFLLTMMAGKAKDPLVYLDMENMYINKESKPILNKILNIGKLVKIGGILSNYEIHGPNTKKLIYERCRYILMKPKKAKARKDFGHFILSLPDHPISPEEFQKELKKMKIKKLDKDLVQALMDLFMNKKKQVNCEDLVRDYMTYYPDTKLPPPKPKKGKKGGKKKGKGKEIEIQVHDLENAPPLEADDQPAAESSANDQEPLEQPLDLAGATPINADKNVEISEARQEAKSITDDAPISVLTDDPQLPSENTANIEPPENTAEVEAPPNEETNEATN